MPPIKKRLLLEDANGKLPEANVPDRLGEPELSATFVTSRPWAGKTIYLYGDSRSSLDYSWYGTMLAAKTGATVIVGGKSGSTIAAQTNNAWLDVVVAAQPHLVIILGEGNDQGVAGTVGTFSAAAGEAVVVDPDPAVPYAGTKLIEAAAYIVRYLNSKLYLTGTKILYLNGMPQNRTDHAVANAWNNPLNHQRKAAAIAEVCDRYHIHMLDSLKLCGWDTSLEPFWVSPTNKTANLGTYTMDGLHLNDAGYDRLTDVLNGVVLSSIRPVRFVPVAPPQVAGLAVGTPSATTVPLSWTAAARATSYLVEAQIGSGAWSSVGTTSGTSLTATGLTPSTSYTFRVSGVNIVGSGPASATVAAATVAPPPLPSKVVGLTAGTATAGTQPISWTASSNAARYLVEYKTTAASVWSTFSSTTTATAVTIAGLAASTSYNYRVTGVNDTGSGTVSDTLTAATPAIVPITDDFNRADNSTTLGTAPTGQAWEVLTSGTTFGISSNRASKTATGTDVEGVAVLETGRSDVDISITVAAVGGGLGPVFRATDAQNCWVVDGGNGHKLYKRVGGSFGTPLGTVATAAAVGDVVRVIASGNTISASVNGGTPLVVTDSFNQTATKHGIRISGTGAPTGRLDNLSIV